MPITEKQREQRRKHIGSSDMAAILGLDPYRNAMDVYLEKTGQVQESGGENEFMRTGRLLEEPILQFASEELGVKIRRNQYRSLPEFHLGANIDGLLEDTGEPVEAKSVHSFSTQRKDWGEPWTDQVPARVIIQSHVHLLCCNGTKPVRCYVPVYLDGRFQMYHVDRSESICDTIKRAAETFWFCVEQKSPPDQVPALQTAKKVCWYEPEQTAEIKQSLIEDWLEAKKDISEATERKNKAEAALIMAMKGADFGYGGELGDIKRITVKPTKIFDSKRFKAEQGDLFSQYLKDKPGYSYLKYVERKESE